MRHVALVGAAIAAILLLASQGSAAPGSGGTVVDRGGGIFDLEDDEGLVSFTVAGTDFLTVIDFKVAVGGEAPAYRSVLESLEIPSFSRTGPPLFEGEAALVQGAEARLEVHGSPTASMDLSTAVPDSVTIRPAAGVGVLPRGGVALIGDESFTAEAVVVGDGAMVKAGDALSVNLAASDRLLLRKAYLGHEMGEHIRSGVLAAEAYVSSGDEGASLDVVQYQPLGVTLDSSSMTRKALTLSGDLSGAKVVIVNVARKGFTVPSADLVTSLDGSEVPRAGGLDDVMSAGGPSYVSFESDSVLQVFVRIPGLSTSTLVLSGPGPAPFGYFVPLALGAAFALTIAAAAYLFRPED